MKFRKSATIAAVIAIAVATPLTIVSVFAPAIYVSAKPADSLLEVHIFQLQNSISVFAITPNEKILINGGSNSEIIRYITGLIPFHSRKIDTIIATDANPKNITGLIDVAERYEIGNAFVIDPDMAVVATSTLPTDPTFGILFDTLQKNGASINKIPPPPSTSPALSIDFLFPPPREENFKYSKASPPEIVPRLVYGSSSFIFLGSASPKIQKYIASSTQAKKGSANSLKTDVLIVSRNAGTDMAAEFLAMTDPTYLVHSQSSPAPAPSVGQTKSPAQPKKRAPQSSLRKKPLKPTAAAKAGIDEKHIINTKIKSYSHTIFLSDGTRVWLKSGQKQLGQKLR